MSQVEELRNILYVTIKHDYSCGLDLNYYNLYGVSNNENKYVLEISSDSEMPSGNTDKMFYSNDEKKLMDLIIEDCISTYKELEEKPKQIEKTSGNYLLHVKSNRKEIQIKSQYVDIFNYIVEKLNKLSNNKYTVKPMIAPKSKVYTIQGDYIIKEAELVKSDDESNTYIYEYTIADDYGQNIKISEKDLMEQILK